MGQIGNDGRCAGAGAAAHAGGDKDHVRTLKGLGDDGTGFLRGLLAGVGLGAGAHAAGQLLADLQLVRASGFVQVLLIGIDSHEFDAVNAAVDHSVDNIVAGAADADDLNIDNLICINFGHMLSSYVRCRFYGLHIRPEVAWGYDTHIYTLLF